MAHSRLNTTAAALTGLCLLGATAASAAGPVEDLQGTITSQVGGSALAPAIQTFVQEQLLSVMNNEVFVF